MEGQPFGENGVVTTRETFDEPRLHSNAAFSRSVRGVTGAAQQPLHLARPLFFLDFDESLELAQVMGIAQGMQHALHRVIGLPVIVNDDAGDIRQETAALGADAIEGRLQRAHQASLLEFTQTEVEHLAALEHWRYSSVLLR